MSGVVSDGFDGPALVLACLIRISTALWLLAHFAGVGLIAWVLDITVSWLIPLAGLVHESIGVSGFQDEGSLAKGDTVSDGLSTDSNWYWAPQIQHDVESVGQHGGGGLGVRHGTVTRIGLLLGPGKVIDSADVLPGELKWDGL